MIKILLVLFTCATFAINSTHAMQPTAKASSTVELVQVIIKEVSGCNFNKAQELLEQYEASQIKALINHQVKVYREDTASLFHIALSKFCSYDFFTFLVTNGADINAPDSKGTVPLRIALDNWVKMLNKKPSDLKQDIKNIMIHFLHIPTIDINAIAINGLACANDEDIELSILAHQHLNVITIENALKANLSFFQDKNKQVCYLSALNMRSCLDNLPEDMLGNNIQILRKQFDQITHLEDITVLHPIAYIGCETTTKIILEITTSLTKKRTLSTTLIPIFQNITPKEIAQAQLQKATNPFVQARYIATLQAMRVTFEEPTIISHQPPRTVIVVSKDAYSGPRTTTLPNTPQEQRPMPQSTVPLDCNATIRDTQKNQAFINKLTYLIDEKKFAQAKTEIEKIRRTNPTELELILNSLQTFPHYPGVKAFVINIAVYNHCPYTFFVFLSELRNHLFELDAQKEFIINHALEAVIRATDQPELLDDSKKIFLHLLHTVDNKHKYLFHTPYESSNPTEISMALMSLNKGLQHTDEQMITSILACSEIDLSQLNLMLPIFTHYRDKGNDRQKATVRKIDEAKRLFLELRKETLTPEHAFDALKSMLWVGNIASIQESCNRHPQLVVVYRGEETPVDIAFELYNAAENPFIKDRYEKILKFMISAALKQKASPLYVGTYSKGKKKALNAIITETQSKLEEEKPQTASEQVEEQKPVTTQEPTPEEREKSRREKQEAKEAAYKLRQEEKAKTEAEKLAQEQAVEATRVARRIAAQKETEDKRLAKEQAVQAEKDRIEEEAKQVRLAQEAAAAKKQREEQARQDKLEKEQAAKAERNQQERNQRIAKEKAQQEKTKHREEAAQKEKERLATEAEQQEKTRLAQETEQKRLEAEKAEARRKEIERINKTEQKIPTLPVNQKTGREKTIKFNLPKNTVIPTEDSTVIPTEDSTVDQKKENEQHERKINQTLLSSLAIA